MLVRDFRKRIIFKNFFLNFLSVLSSSLILDTIARVHGLVSERIIERKEKEENVWVFYEFYRKIII